MQSEQDAQGDLVDLNDDRVAVEGSGVEKTDEFEASLEADLKPAADAGQLTAQSEIPAHSNSSNLEATEDGPGGPATAASLNGAKARSSESGGPLTIAQVKEAAQQEAEAMKKLEQKWAGKMLGKFRLSKILGHGGMGVVFQARDVNLKRVVALKVLRKRIAGANESDQIELFLREARAAASLDHPNIVQIYEIADVQGWWYIAMEFLEGGSIQQMVKGNGPLDPLRAAMLTADAARGLEEAHDSGIIHRDIKPGNLMLARKGRCKVADFGLVRFTDPNDPFHLNNVAVGTPLYLAPEIIQLKSATAASDVYALGISLHFMLTGKVPYRATTKKEIFRLHVEGPIPDVREFNPACSENLANLLKKTLAKNPEERPTAATLATVLQTEVASLTPATGISMSSHSSSTGAMPAIASSSSLLGVSGIEAYAPPKTSSSPTHVGQSSSSTQPVPIFRPWVVGTILLVGVLLGGLMFAMVAMTMGHEETKVIAPTTAEAVESPSNRMEHAEVVDMQAKAQTYWKQVSALDRGQGFEQKLLDAEVSKNKADAFMTSHDTSMALQEYESFINRTKELLALEQLRKTAIESRTKAQAMAKTASDDGANAGESMSQFASADHLRMDAGVEFDKGNFDSAVTKWKLAADGYRNADAIASQWIALKRSKQDFEVALAKINPGDMEREVPQAWTAANNAIRAAQKERIDPVAGARAYDSARDALGVAVDALNVARTQKKKMEDEARAKHVADLVQQATGMDDSKHGRAALALLDEALKLDPTNDSATKLRTKIAAYYNFKPGQVITNASGFNLAYIPPGDFMMGSTGGEPERKDDERQHHVILTRGIFMGVTAVTQAQWEKVMGKDYKSPDGVHPDDAAGTRFIGDDLPADGVSWNEAVEFCKRLSKLEGRTYRLPTEAEREYACRAGTKTIFNIGDTLTSADANIDGYDPYNGAKRSPSQKRTMPVASFKANAWNLYDMHGNVMEWCSDWYAPFGVGEVTDPAGPADGGPPDQATKVIRGGSWKHGATNARSANRSMNPPVIKANYIGFRIVLEAE